MQLWCPFAERRPLGALSAEPRIGVPRVMIVHTMVGFLRGTENMFRGSGYGGTESTFGVGGAADPAGLDGAIWQWQALDHQADAQYDGNAYATSVETSDGGKPRTPWSTAQCEALVRLGLWWCEQTGHPARLVASPSQSGFGWHNQFRIWNRQAHECPGAVRLGQFKSEIVPEIARRRKGTPQPPGGPQPWPGRLLEYPPVMRGDDVRQWQQGAVRRGHQLAVDGVYGPDSQAVCRAIQRAAGLDLDGVVGPLTWQVTFPS